MAKKQKQPEKTCADCIHESACRVWTDGRAISDASASQCPSHETVKESGAYLCGVLDERKRKQTNADRIRAMSDEELAEHLYYGFDVQYCHNYTECAAMLDAEEGIPEARCKGCVLEWLKQPAEDDHG